MITIFEDFNNADLRKMPKYLKCIKNKGLPFTKGNVYKITGMWGDPQRALEEFGIKDFMPVECISYVSVFGGDNKNHNFKVGVSYGINTTFPYVFEFFEFLNEKEEKLYTTTDKYNI